MKSKSLVGSLEATISGAHSTAAGDIPANAASFAPHLRAANKSPMTITSSMEAVSQLDAYLAEHGMPQTVAALHREHVEAFIEDQLARLNPASACTAIGAGWRPGIRIGSHEPR